MSVTPISAGASGSGQGIASDFGLAPPVIDPYSFLDHKAGMAYGQPAWTMPGWVPKEDRRRLTAYLIYAAYLHNTARTFLPATLNIEERKQRREYGDPDLLVSTAHAALLGDEQQLVVDVRPGAPVITDGDADVDDATKAAAEQADDARQARQAWLDEWADRERFWLKLAECERNAIGEGDGIYVLGWSQKHKRIRVRQYEPDCYFPVLTGDEDIDEFPGKIHLAWQSELPNGDRLLRRITLELVDLHPNRHTDLRAVTDPDSGEVIAWERTCPWDPDNPARVTCEMSDGTWRLQNLDSKTVTDLSDSGATWAEGEDGVALHGYDLRLDFIPAVHVPNTPAGAEHYGQSILAVVAQILDDLSANDSDTATQAATAAIAHAVYTGATAGDQYGGPGVAESLPAGARKELLDTSHALTALHAQGDRLRKVMSSNSRISEALLGRVDVGRLPSGVALALLFSPTQSLLRALRGVRAVKYEVLLRFVQRIAIAGGVLDDDKVVYPAGVAFGSYLPADKAAAVSNVAALRTARMISTLTGVGMLVEAGFSIGDAQAEVERINAENFAEALALLDATGDEQAVRDYLGLDGPPPGGPLPPGGTGATGAAS